MDNIPVDGPGITSVRNRVQRFTVVNLYLQCVTGINANSLADDTFPLILINHQTAHICPIVTPYLLVEGTLTCLSELRQRPL